MTLRYTKGIYRGFLPYEALDAREFGDWPDDEPLPVMLVEREEREERYEIAAMDTRQQRRASAYIETGKFVWPGEAEAKGSD